MILSKLKEQTAEQHQRFEGKLDILARLSSAQGYKSLLQQFYGFYRPLEMRLGSVMCRPGISLNFTARRKTPLLERDLLFLDLPERELRALPQCQKLPAVESEAQAFGCLYVLEGATLGGQIISRYVADKLGYERERGASFFTSYGAEVGAMWRSFGQAISDYATAHDADDEIIAAARDTFHKFDKWLFAGDSPDDRKLRQQRKD
jgi:heme oxygenase